MYLFFKRFFDIIISFTVIILLLPVFIPVIIILLLTGENQVIYLQKRVGKNNDEFAIFKFVTMIKNSPNLGSGIYTAKNDSRILPFGKFLRKTKINELPQILNILIGDMSFVGPRPLIKETFLFYKPNDQKIITSVKPGLTGIGSVVFRDEGTLLSKSSVGLELFYKKNIAPNKAALEKWYTRNIGFSTDFFIIVSTAWVILFPNSKIINILFKDLPELKFNF